MSKFDKLLERLLSLDKNLRYEDLEKILLYYGYTYMQDGTSHCVFRKPRKQMIVIPRHATIKTVYIKLVKKAVEEELENENS